MGRLIEFRTTSGAAVVAQGIRVTPQSHALIVRLPFGAFVWHRPGSILVEREGQLERRRIVDLTRIAELTLWLGVLLVRVAGRSRHKKGVLQ